uniref:DUF393 domain-containing protein n=1 Tax=Neobodo designis TaxID=312471 RepID=A0A7S1LTD5_NEODS|mmetsp:Transcript_279/g.1081  ORF Transcript_279/g.1081 Transcript_279/m.1081 type:complete len:205 (+) Transcript_279:30-644(+)
MIRRACARSALSRAAPMLVSAPACSTVARWKSHNGSYLGPSLEVFYDGGCPLCRREIDLCMKWDEDRNSVKFTDISTDEFDAKKETGLPLCLLEDRIHARDLTLSESATKDDPDRGIISGMVVFRRMYYHMGWDSRYNPPSPKIAPRFLGAVFAVTGIPGIRCLSDCAYNGWATFRLWNRDRKAKNDKKNGKTPSKCASGKCSL